MWTDPGWPFGIAFIILAISLRKALPRLLNSIADHRSAQVERGASAEEVEELRRHLAELEERMDFAERMLTEQRTAAKLPGAGR